MSDNQINNTIETNNSVNYWRSLKELNQDKETLLNSENEFQPGVKDDFDGADNLTGMSRRKFLALLGATAAFAATGCSDYRDKGEIVPYNKKPEEVIIGKPNYYASTCTLCPNSCGILIKTREGRPIKVDGNPDHPISKGKICAIGEASVLNLYDPARLKNPLSRGSGKFAEVSWTEVDDVVLKALNSTEKESVAIIASRVVSPSAAKLIDEFKAKYPAAKFYFYDMLSSENKQKAWKNSYGSENSPVIAWEKARVILTLEGDFLGNEGNVIEQIRKYSANRDVDSLDTFNRLYSIEGNFSLTGLNADYRFRLRPDAQLEFVLALINEIAFVRNSSVVAFDGGVRNIISSFSLDKVAGKYLMDKEPLMIMVKDLIEQKGKAIVYAGQSLPEDVHVAVNLLNEVLGNTALYSKDSAKKSYFAYSSTEELVELVNNINSGKIKSIVHYDTNPVFTFPVNLNYGEAIKKVGLVVSLVEYENESSATSKFVLPINHSFESWGDAKVRTGYYSTQQPVIAPLYNSRQKEAVLLNWLSGKGSDQNLYHDFVKNNWKTKIYPSLKTSSDFERFWIGVLHDGVIPENEAVKVDFKFDQKSLSGIKPQTDLKDFALLLTGNYSVSDGKYAHNGWLMEMPHPVSKVTWDNYAAVSYSTSKKLGLGNGDLIDIQTESGKITVPALIQPGVADDTVAIALGYGRKYGPVVALNSGFNAGILLNSKNSRGKYLYSGVVVTKASGNYKLVSTQDHHAFDNALIKDQHKKREIIREGTLLQYKKDPKFIKTEEREKKELEDKKVDLYEHVSYKDLKWGMSIDLNKCIGCSQCTIACDVENNIPVVGKEQVSKGRIMHWIRMDRYYSGTADNPQASVEPMLCQHCDNAPCENVCPVVATNHSPDGLNQMVYNRCVGTRYCSNNCPYKVRRYNFLNFRDHFKDGFYQQPSIELAMNPEVTVRSRGVMEKCTFCVQRISEAKSLALAEGRTLKGSDVKTACQTTCPAEAITFGDMNDKKSEIFMKREHELGYHVLEELNIKPNVTYIAKLRNTHSEEA